MMTETISPPDSQAVESPHLARPETDAAALRAIEEATEHVRECALRIRANPEERKPRLVLSQHVRRTSILDRIADAVSKDMPGRQREIQDCVDKILAKVDPEPAAS
jgi:hypothetical protein